MQRSRNKEVWILLLNGYRHSCKWIRKLLLQHEYCYQLLNGYGHSCKWIRKLLLKHEYCYLLLKYGFCCNWIRKLLLKHKYCYQLLKYGFCCKMDMDTVPKTWILFLKHGYCYWNTDTDSKYGNFYWNMETATKKEYCVKKWIRLLKNRKLNVETFLNMDTVLKIACCYC